MAARVAAVGEVIIPDTYTDGSRTCLSAPGDANAEYALALISSAALFSTVTPVDVYARGNTHGVCDQSAPAGSRVNRPKGVGAAMI